MKRVEDLCLGELAVTYSTHAYDGLNKMVGSEIRGHLSPVIVYLHSFYFLRSLLISLSHCPCSGSLKVHFISTWKEDFNNFF